jgi:hypothetical protein
VKKWAYAGGASLSSRVSPRSLGNGVCGTWLAVLQPGIACWITAAYLRCQGYFLGKLREELPSFLVEGTIDLLNFGPLAMTRHGSGMLCNEIGVRAWELACEESPAERVGNAGARTDERKVPNDQPAVNRDFAANIRVRDPLMDGMLQRRH